MCSQALVSYELQRQLAADDITIHYVNPGAVNSDIWRDMPAQVGCPLTNGVRGEGMCRQHGSMARVKGTSCACGGLTALRLFLRSECSPPFPVVRLLFLRSDCSCGGVQSL
eukprot:1021128-Prorocentrum_minimum.AAC.2